MAQSISFQEAAALAKSATLKRSTHSVLLLHQRGQFDESCTGCVWQAQN